MTDRKTQIITAATTLFLKDGVGVSTARIATAAGVSNGTLFNTFATKQCLIDSIYKDAKMSMASSFCHLGDAPFTRKNLYENWRGYLEWACAHPEIRRIMHLLRDAGLASAPAKAEVGVIAEPYNNWLHRALDAGTIRGPNVNFIRKHVMLQLDLAITENLNNTEADLAFEMLCKSIGLTQ